MSENTNTMGGCRFCTFLLGDYYLGIDVREVQEVLRHQVMTRVPLAPYAVRGLINVRGQIVTAIDLRRRLQLPERPDDQLPINVIIRTDEAPVSLLVDELCDVVDVDRSTVQTPPDTLEAPLGELILGVCMLPERMLMLLGTDGMMDLGANATLLSATERTAER